MDSTPGHRRPSSLVPRPRIWVNHFLSFKPNPCNPFHYVRSLLKRAQILLFGIGSQDSTALSSSPVTEADIFVQINGRNYVYFLIAMQRISTTVYYFQFNGMIERQYLAIKTALKGCNSPIAWYENLGFVLLGSRTAPKKK